MIGDRSLGSGATYPLDGTAAQLNVVLNNMAIAGIIVVVAAGNAGVSGGL